MREESLRGPGLRDHQARQPLRRRRRGHAGRGLQQGLKTDPTSAFGGIIAFNREVDERGCPAVAKQFVEVLMAPSFTAEALEVFKAKVNVRLLQIAIRPRVADAWEQGRNAQDVAGSGLLIQTADNHFLQKADLKVVSTLQPTAQQIDDLMFAWTVAQYVKSNAIVFCGGGMTLGVGAGQMSRVDSDQDRRHQGRQRGPRAAGFGGRQRRILPVPRRPRCGGRRGCELRDPARRLGA